VEIDPNKVRVIAGAVDEASHLLGATLASKSSGLAPASCAESATAAALRSASALWNGLFRRVGGAVDMFGASLVAAADAHAAADRRAAARMDSADRLVGP
jgi:hypothetical protein